MTTSTISKTTANAAGKAVASQPTVQSRSSLIREWLRPRSTDPAVMFRERTVRLLTLVMVPLLFTSLITTLLLVSEPWEMVSIKTDYTITLILGVLCMYAVHRGKVRAASFLVVLNGLVHTAFTLIVYGPTFTWLIGAIISLILSALVLPRYWLFILTVMFTVAVTIVSLLTPGAMLYITTIVVVAFLTLVTTSALLYILRTEFDYRLMVVESARIEAEQARDAAELASKAKDQFLSTMSHELRTPLGAITGFVGILQTGMIKDRSEALPLSGTQKEMLRSINDNAEHLLAIINNILDLAKLSAGQAKIKLMPVNPRAEGFIANTVSSLQSLAISKGIELKMEFGSNLPTQVECDSLQIQQIVKNLTGNAIKFTEKGGVTVRVDSPDAATWQIAVKDTGIGIKPDALARIFDPFYQADGGDSRQWEGTGLGLAITKSYIDLHHGTIGVESTPNAGTTFTVTLPVRVAVDPMLTTLTAPSITPSIVRSADHAVLG